MNTLNVKHGNYRLVVAEATAKMGMMRSILVSKAIEEEGKSSAPSLEAAAQRLMHTVLYPAMIAAVVEHEGFSQWPIPFEAFCELPEEFVMQWEEATFSLNKHWLPREQGKEQKKK